MKNRRLLKDIVIPAGTIFESIDGRESKYINGNISHIFGLTKDSYGELIYGIDELDTGIGEWFEEVE